MFLLKVKLSLGGSVSQCVYKVPCISEGVHMIALNLAFNFESDKTTTFNAEAGVDRESSSLQRP